MALTRIPSTQITDNAVTTAKIDDATVIETDIVDGTITNTMVDASAAIAHTKLAVGTAAPLNVGTSANQILQLNGSGVLPALDGTQLTGIQTDFSPLERQLARLALHIGAVEQLTKFSMIDQCVDNYEDASGITAYNGPVTTSSSASEWSGSTGSFTFSGNNVTATGGNKAIRTAAITGDCNLEFTATTTHETMCFGFYESSEDGTFNSTAGRGGMDSMTNSWLWRDEGTDRVGYGSNLALADIPIADGNTVKLERLSGEFKLHVNGSVVYTWSQQSTNPLRLCFAVDGPSSSAVYTGVTWTTSPAAVNTGSSQSAARQGSAGAKYYEGHATAQVGVGWETGDRRSSITVTHSGLTVAGGTVNGMLDGVTNAYGISAWFAASVSAGAYLRFQFDSAKVITENKWYQNTTHSGATWQWQGSNDATTWTNIGSPFQMICNVANQGTVNTQLNGNTTAYTYYQMLYVSGSNNANPYWQEIEFYIPATAASDSMSLISTTTTANSAVTKADILVQTEDELGTATINTDIKAGVSRDALNYVETTLVNKGTWGTNKHILAANDVTIPGTVMTKIITVAASKLVTDGTSQATLTLTEGYTYKFDTSDSTMSGHTFSFATAADAAGSTQYTTGVTTNGTPGNAGAYTQIVVAASAPTLYYYCANHGSMGGTANTPAETSTTSMRYKIETKNQSYTAPFSDYSGSAHTVTANGSVAFSTTTKKIGTSSIYFTGGKLEIPSSTDFDFAGDFTIEYWINSTDTGTTSSSTNSRVMSRGDHPDEWFIRADSSSGVEAMKLQFGGTDDLNLHTGGTADTWADGTWHHFAVTRDGNTVRLYIDGTQIDTTTVSGAFDAGDGANLYIGNEDDDSEDFHGYLDEIRISNNCRYPSGTTFTPSTTAFTSDANTKLLIHGDGASGKVTRIHGTSLAWS